MTSFKSVPSFPAIKGTRAVVDTPRAEQKPSASASHADETPERPPRRSGVEACPRCHGTGTFVDRSHGGMWWQARHLRCAYCHGTGRIIPNTEGDEQ